MMKNDQKYLILYFYYKNGLLRQKRKFITVETLVSKLKK